MIPQRRMRISVLLSLLVAVCVSGCSVESVQAQFEVEMAFPELRFKSPLGLRHAGDGSDRIFVVERNGIIKVFDNDPSITSTSVFLDIEDRVNAGGEEGLLGLAFHPNYATNGYFYVYYSVLDPRRSIIARYTVDAADPNLADPSSEVVVLEVEQPFRNHNGGQIAFGPDGYLYIALGDGGMGGDPLGHGQNLQTLLGSILRIDVDNPDDDRMYGIPGDNPYVGNTSGFREEIFAYGLRNPWRFSFDPVTGMLWAGDVGQGRFEEVNIIEKGGNYGWKTMEGFQCFSPSSGCDQTGLTLPVIDYAHNNENKSITGGFVYRGSRIPELIGQYIYADYIDGRIWALDYDGQQVVQNTELIDSELRIASFGVDEANELYMCSFDGRIYRFAPTSTGIVEAEVPRRPGVLRANHPNPFRTTTTISYALDQAAPVMLAVYDVQGRHVRTLAEGMQPSGEHVVRWDGYGEDGQWSAGGVYFLRFVVAGIVAASQPMVLVR